MAKPAQLVCQHLENVSGDVLEKYQAIIREYAGDADIGPLCLRALALPQSSATLLHPLVGHPLFCSSTRLDSGTGS